MKSLAQITQLVGWLDDMMGGWVNGWMEDEQTSKQKEKYLIGRPLGQGEEGDSDFHFRNPIIYTLTRLAQWMEHHPVD